MNPTLQISCDTAHFKTQCDELVLLLKETGDRGKAALGDLDRFVERLCDEIVLSNMAGGGVNPLVVRVSFRAGGLYDTSIAALRALRSEP